MSGRVVMTWNDDITRPAVPRPTPRGVPATRLQPPPKPRVATVLGVPVRVETQPRKMCHDHPDHPSWASPEADLDRDTLSTWDPPPGAGDLESDLRYTKDLMVRLATTVKKDRIRNFDDHREFRKSMERNTMLSIIVPVVGAVAIASVSYYTARASESAARAQVDAIVKSQSSR